MASATATWQFADGSVLVFAAEAPDSWPDLLDQLRATAAAGMRDMAEVAGVQTVEASDELEQ